MRENRDMVVSMNPSLNELEIIAFLQAKWECLEDKSKYEDVLCQHREDQEQEKD